MLTYEIDDGLDQEHDNNLMIWEMTEIITKSRLSWCRNHHFITTPTNI